MREIQTMWTSWSTLRKWQVSKEKNGFQQVWAWVGLTKVFLFSYSSSAWLQRQSKLSEAAEVNRTVGGSIETVILLSFQLLFMLKKLKYLRVKSDFYPWWLSYIPSSAAPSSPQRGLADRMFLEGPAMRISTCKHQRRPYELKPDGQHVPC